jgi:hypothetical protein
MEDIRKPAAWMHLSFDELLGCEAGRAYVAEQLDGEIDEEFVFRSSKTNADACSYSLYSDESLWFHSNAEDEVWTDANDFILELGFTDAWWSDCDDRDGALVDDMDKGLLIHLLGEEDAVDFFEARGGIVRDVC